MQKIGIMQPYLFPYIGYFQLIDAVDIYVVYDDAQFMKGGWINRNNINIGGNKVRFTVSLEGASSNKKINEISISDDFIKLVKTIEMAYSKAPHSGVVLDLLKTIFNYPDKNLANFTKNSIEKICEYIGINTKIVLSSGILKKTNNAQDKVIEICKSLEGDYYLNAIGGKDLYNKNDFEKNGLKLGFIKSRIPEYAQFKGDFVPGLSIIDVLMFNSKHEIKQMMKEYDVE